MQNLVTRLTHAEIELKINLETPQARMESITLPAPVPINILEFENTLGNISMTVPEVAMNTPEVVRKQQSFASISDAAFSASSSLQSGLSLEMQSKIFNQNSSFSVDSKSAFSAPLLGDDDDWQIFAQPLEEEIFKSPEDPSNSFGMSMLLDHSEEPKKKVERKKRKSPDSSVVMDSRTEESLAELHDSSLSLIGEKKNKKRLMEESVKLFNSTSVEFDDELRDLFKLADSDAKKNKTVKPAVPIIQEQHYDVFDDAAFNADEQVAPWSSNSSSNNSFSVPSPNLSVNSAALSATCHSVALVDMEDGSKVRKDTFDFFVFLQSFQQSKLLFSEVTKSTSSSRLKTSAFYHVLVLATNGMISVDQSKPFSEIQIIC